MLFFWIALLISGFRLLWPLRLQPLLSFSSLSVIVVVVSACAAGCRLTCHYQGHFGSFWIRSNFADTRNTSCLCENCYTNWSIKDVIQLFLYYAFKHMVTSCWFFFFLHELWSKVGHLLCPFGWQQGNRTFYNAHEQRLISWENKCTNDSKCAWKAKIDKIHHSAHIMSKINAPPQMISMKLLNCTNLLEVHLLRRFSGRTKRSTKRRRSSSIEFKLW